MCIRDRLNANQFIYKRAGNPRWIAYQTKIQNGLLDHKPYTYTKDDGTEKTVDQVMVTEKGVLTLAKKLGVTLPTEEA